MMAFVFKMKTNSAWGMALECRERKGNSLDKDRARARVLVDRASSCVMVPAAIKVFATARVPTLPIGINNNFESKTHQYGAFLISIRFPKNKAVSPSPHIRVDFDLFCPHPKSSCIL